MRHKNCPEDCALKIGRKLEKTRTAGLKAFCFILTKDVRAINNLDVVSDVGNHQHRRHADITGFSEAKMRAIADDLAEPASENKSLVVF